MDFITQNEASMRMGVFITILAIMMAAEALMPRKARVQRRGGRWASNMLLVVIDSLVVRLLFPIAAVGAASYAAAQGWGLLNLIALPAWLSVLAAIIILDMMIYWQHVISHKWAPLWALHKVHHSDRDIDVTTALRFHPLEIVLSMGFKMALVLALGAPVMAVIVFEIILNGCAMFNHSNVRFGRGFDKALRAVMVTPDMHRVHHSIIERETNSNYGFSTSLWDRLFKSYIPQPAKGHDEMIIGLENYQDKSPANLLWVLWLPFKGKD